MIVSAWKVGINCQFYQFYQNDWGNAVWYDKVQWW